MTTATTMRCGWGRRAIDPFADPESHTLDAACGRRTETIYDIFGRLVPVCDGCAPAAIRVGAVPLSQEEK